MTTFDFDSIVLRRSSGFTRWKSLGVVDDASRSDRAKFVRAELVADAIDGLIADAGLTLGRPGSGTVAALNEMSTGLTNLARELRQ